jgi:hypothetical protein
MYKNIGEIDSRTLLEATTSQKLYEKGLREKSTMALGPAFR